MANPRCAPCRAKRWSRAPSETGRCRLKQRSLSKDRRARLRRWSKPPPRPALCSCTRRWGARELVKPPAPGDPPFARARFERERFIAPAEVFFYQNFGDEPSEPLPVEAAEPARGEGVWIK